ncbi:hypothetical protein CEXT_776071 [Caerostris extrusa]|uniref:Uncharacterized protein n=1 Tax=Caerostris extrusa TaxID=172846 RepID=A0AAV4TEF9_CAEEX|nr:hypothetical protein CEXT_776071 [Caerostris extrusa]
MAHRKYGSIDQVGSAVRFIDQVWLIEQVWSEVHGSQFQVWSEVCSSCLSEAWGLFSLIRHCNGEKRELQKPKHKATQVSVRAAGCTREWKLLLNSVPPHLPSNREIC